MRWRVTNETDVRVAAMTAVLAAAFALGAAWWATRIAPVEAAPPMATPDTPAAPMPDPPVPLDRMVALAPFSPDRRATSAPATPAQVAPANLAGAIRLVGTVVGSGDAFAVCRVGVARPRTMHAGDTLGGWTLRTIAPARVVFIDAAGAVHELRFNSPGN